jgi:hypothetical protein
VRVDELILDGVFGEKCLAFDSKAVRGMFTGLIITFSRMEKGFENNS